MATESDVVQETNGRKTGKCIKFHKRRGFGFIQPDGTSDKKDQLFVHYSDIQTDDQWPQITSGLEVEFEIGEGKKGKKVAKNVSQVGGAKIHVSTDEGKEWDDTVRTGTVKFFDWKKGFGFIEFEEPITFKGTTEESNIYVARENLICEDNKCWLESKAKVQFNVYHDGKKLGAGKVCQVGGAPLCPSPKTKGKKRTKNMSMDSEEAEAGAPVKKTKTATEEA